MFASRQTETESFSTIIFCCSENEIRRIRIEIDNRNDRIIRFYFCLFGFIQFFYHIEYFGFLRLEKLENLKNLELIFDSFSQSGYWQIQNWAIPADCNLAKDTPPPLNVFKECQKILEITRQWFVHFTTGILRFWQVCVS